MHKLDSPGIDNALYGAQSYSRNSIARWWLLYKQRLYMSKTFSQRLETICCIVFIGTCLHVNLNFAMSWNASMCCHYFKLRWWHLIECNYFMGFELSQVMTDDGKGCMNHCFSPMGALRLSCAYPLCDQVRSMTSFFNVNKMVNLIGNRG